MSDVELRHVQGAGRFVADLVEADGAIMVILRAPVAHGVIKSLDIDEAASHPGVLDVLTPDILDAEGVGFLNTSATVESADGTAMKEPNRPVLAKTKVVHLGQPVAALVAENLNVAMEAVELIVLEIDDLEPVIDPVLAKSSDAIWAEIPQNEAFHWEKGNRAETEAAFSQADHVVSLDIRHPRMSVAPMETRGCIASFQDGRFELVTGSQGVMSIRRALAETLSVAESDIRVVTPDVGGSFAVKIWAYPEHVLALVAARRLGRTVHWMATRGESLQADAAGRGRVDKAELAFNKNGTVTGFRVQAIADMGAFLNSVGPYVATGGAVRPFGQCYDIPAMHYDVSAVYTNSVPTDAYRGAGKPESAATLERLLDLAAAELAMDPLELRQHNLLRPEKLPYATAMGETYDGGDFPRLSDELKDQADWTGYANRVSKSESKGLRRGRAVGFHLHATGGSTAERSEIAVLPGGMFRVRTGTQDTGQGHFEALARVASNSLGVPLEKVVVEQGDSDVLSKGGGTGGSCLMPVAANTIHRTALHLIEDTKEKAAERLEAAVVDIVYGEGTFQVAGTDRHLAWGDLVVEDEEEPSCAAALDFEGLHTTFPNGGYVVEVELDPETGRITIDHFIGLSDVGEVVSRHGVLGQIRGGIVQALGEVMMEELVQSEDGQLLTGSFMDYALPRADDVPDLKMELCQTPSPNSELGVKGVGELPSIGAPGVLMNAIIDAAQVRHIDKPLTPSRIWQAMQEEAQT